jgi:hypothetical protein
VSLRSSNESQATRFAVKRIVVAAVAALLAHAALARPAAPACDHVVLVLDPRITAAVIDQDWASGASHDEAAAVLELRGCRNERLDRLELAGPLAILDPTPLRGTPEPTWLVTADLTASAGATSGPLTLPVEVVSHRLRVARARGPDGRLAPIRLAATGHAAWQRLGVGSADHLLCVSWEPQGDARWATTYRRYRIGAHGWRWRERRDATPWESDTDFPDAALFP